MEPILGDERGFAFGSKLWHPGRVLLPLRRILQFY
jgi:hypothetical protein